VWSRSEGGRTGGAINRKPLQKKNNSEATGVKTGKISKQGVGPALFFPLITSTQSDKHSLGRQAKIVPAALAY
jgi:hypothetical protein